MLYEKIEGCPHEILTEGEQGSDEVIVIDEDGNATRQPQVVRDPNGVY